MARTSDYVGLSFGSFEIGSKVGSGASADVFACRHEGTGILYVLRLDSEDRALWEGNPMLPPRNASIEVPNANGTWHSELVSYEATMESVQAQGSDAWKLVSVPIYGILEQRYLVPVASPVRVKGAWDVTRLLETAPPDDLFLFELWEDFLGSLAGAAHGSIEKLASDPWRTVTGGRILSSAIARYLGNGGLDRREQEEITRAASASQVEGPELAENLVLRLCGCVQRGRMSIADAVSTLQCRHFRINITQHEAVQTVALYRILSSSPWE